MKNAFISVIIPAYNTEKYIEATIESVLKQTHSNLEVIIVDDGSTDNTSMLVNNIGKRDPRIKLIKQENKGVSAARNTGFADSKGEYIAYLDSDDIWTPDCLELLLKKFSSDDMLGLVHADYQMMDIKSQISSKVYSGREGYLLDEMLLGGGGKYIFGMSGGLIKREVIESVGGFDTELANGEDHEFYFRVTNKYKIGRAPSVTWYYRIHTTNSHFNIDLLEKDALNIYKKADQHNLFKSPAFRRKCYSNMYFMLAGSLWTSKNRKATAINYLIKSIFMYPPIILKFF